MAKLDNAMIPASQFRICDLCGIPRHDADFSGIKSTKCNPCKDREELQRLKEDKISAANSAVKLLIQHGKNGTDLSSKDIMSNMVERFGGVNGLCEMWHFHLMTAMRNRPGSLGVLRQFSHMVALIDKLNPARDEAVDLSNYSEEQLRDVLRAYVDEHVPTVSAVTSG